MGRCRGEWEGVDGCRGGWVGVWLGRCMAGCRWIGMGG